MMECKREKALKIHSMLCPFSTKEDEEKYITLFCSECKNIYKIKDECQSRLIRKERIKMTEENWTEEEKTKRLSIAINYLVKKMLEKQEEHNRSNE